MFHYSAIEDIIAADRVKAFALYLKLKTYHNNTIFFNTSKHQLAQKTGISHYLLSRLLSEIIKCGWALWSPQGHLCLRSLRYIDKAPKKTIVRFNITTDMSIQQISDIIRATMIKKDFCQQQFMYELHLDRYTEQHRTRLKRLKKYRNGLNEQRQFTSDRRIARQTSLSLSSANRLRHRLQKMGLIETSPKTAVIKRNTEESIPLMVTKQGLLYKSGTNIMVMQGSYLHRVDL
ncbi:MAG: hypothetical protein WC961_07335 [Anaerovoracaceae bacterium]